MTDCLYKNVLDLATHIFGFREEAIAWLSEPKCAFDGRIPFDMIASADGAQLVEEHLQRSRYGFFA